MRVAAPKRATKLMTKLVSAAQQLADFPESGRRPREITADPLMREIVVEQFRVFYAYIPETQLVEVLAVFHSRRDVAELFRSRPGPKTE